ncbi:hypothetical protein KP509_27G047900 [Ceratopteris richardii]|uniref:Uncharacterized protein n=1 Tax=Ceratopteris richardii TaxID=49495 RepID=A0A8T2RI97_CERRI|nr:hypothetical protein KP509_27G047900 [Ceratopteris richardii]
MNRRELILSAALLTIFLMPCCNAAGRGMYKMLSVCLRKFLRSPLSEASA